MKKECPVETSSTYEPTPDEKKSNDEPSKQIVATPHGTAATQERAKEDVASQKKMESKKYHAENFDRSLEQLLANINNQTEDFKGKLGRVDLVWNVPSADDLAESILEYADILKEVSAEKNDITSLGEIIKKLDEFKKLGLELGHRIADKIIAKEDPYKDTTPTLLKNKVIPFLKTLGDQDIEKYEKAISEMNQAK